MNTAGAVVLALVLGLIAVAVWWVLYTRIRAKRLGVRTTCLPTYLPTFLFLCFCATTCA